MSQGRLLAQEGSIEGPVSYGATEYLLLGAIIVVCLIALAVAYTLVRQVLQAGTGTSKMQEIAKAVQEGSRAYLTRQLRTVGLFAVLLFFLLLLLPADSMGIRIGRSIAFLFGAAFSAATGYAGMSLAVRANVRVAAAADRGLRASMPIAFRSGGVAGMFTVGLGLLGAALVVLMFRGDAPSVLFGFGFGAALLAMFMRVGGGIFTKAADVGADLVGKVEQSIPEDDPRNAATIADNVGDNVGDCAGMAADLFESLGVTLVASIVLGAAAFPEDPVIGLMLPLIIMGIGIVASIIGIFVVRPSSDDENPMRVINRGFFAAAIVSAVLVAVVSLSYAGQWQPVVAVILGLVLASVIQLMTSYYTATEYKPVREIAQSSETGPATTILSGFSTGLESTVYAVLAIVGAIGGAVALGAGEPLTYKLFMVSLIGMGMLTTCGVIVSMDTFGPISDNAQGIAEMSGDDVSERGAEVLTQLDAVGNTTKAITKGVAIATAVIAATSLFGSFREALITSGIAEEAADIRVDQPQVLIGLLIGGSVAFMFSAQAIRAVGRAAGRVVMEVRKQFRDHPGIMDYSERPNYGAVVDICTRDSLRELLVPGALAVLAPIATGFLLGYEALGAYLAGAILSGQLLAVMLSNAGGAWDNAKKYVEDGNHGGKHSEPHTATVIGDTVGDPFKDTAGPALNPLIKVMNLVAVLIVPAVVLVDDNVAIRILAGAAAVAVLGWALWRSNRMGGADLMAANVEGSEGSANGQLPEGKSDQLTKGSVEATEAATPSTDGADAKLSEPGR